MSTLAQRVIECMKECGLNQTQVAKRCGVKQPSVAKWVSGKTEWLKSDTALKLATLFRVNVNWLATGEGKKHDVILDGNVAPAPYGSKVIPVVSYVHAGAFTPTGDYLPDETIVVGSKSSDGSFALRIRGDSMEPEYHEGDLIVVDPDIPPRPGDNVVAQIDDDSEATFKKYRLRGRSADGREVFDLVPLNPDYPTYHSDEINIRIVGVETEHRIFKRHRY